MPLTSVHPMVPSFGTVPMISPQMTTSYSGSPLPRAIAPMNPVAQVSISEHSTQCSPAREEGEVNDSELDPDTRRRLLILQHGQDIRGPPPVPLGPPLEVSMPLAQSQPLQPQERWLSLGENVKPRQVSETSREYPSQPQTTNSMKQSRWSFFCGEEDIGFMDKISCRNRRRSKEVYI